MRLDKFLKVSRVIKRRTIAKEVCDQGYVTINERPAKAGAEVKPEDILEIRLGSRVLRIMVISTPGVVKVQDAPQIFKVIEDSADQT
mgnify:CR=1 FL=1